MQGLPCCPTPSSQSQLPWPASSDHRQITRQGLVKFRQSQVDKELFVLGILYIYMHTYNYLECGIVQYANSKCVHYVVQPVVTTLLVISSCSIAIHVKQSHSLNTHVSHVWLFSLFANTHINIDQNKFKLRFPVFQCSHDRSIRSSETCMIAAFEVQRICLSFWRLEFILLELWKNTGAHLFV